ncbi:MAG: hypothetical protein ACK4SY_05485 [Pyrobaculum sp.]
MKALGGFLMGFGTAFLLLALLGYVLYLQYQPTIASYKAKVEALREVTHSPQYTEAIKTIEAAAPYITRLADLLQAALGLQDLATYINYIPQAATFMRQLREIGDAAHAALETIESTPTYLAIIAAVGLAAVAAGAAITRRHNQAELPSRRRGPSPGQSPR